MQDIPPVTGWSLNFIVQLDVHAPGTAGSFLRASDERRQVIAAHLAVQPFPDEARRQKELAQFLSRASHKDILVAAYPTIPEGLRGALARAGPQPHIRPFYRILFREMISNTYAATIIKRLDRLDLLRLRIARLLPADICTPSLVGIVGSVRAATDICKLVDLLSRNGIDRRALAEALRRVTHEKQLPSLWARWSQKLKLPPHPVAASAYYKPISSGEELRQLALRYRNCAARYLAEVMHGESAFAEFEHAGKGAVVHLSRVGDRWKLAGLFGKDNTMLAAEIQSAARDHLAMQGVSLDEQRRELGEWSVLRRLTGMHTFIG